MFCNCKTFYQDLLNLSHEIITKEDQNSQWNAFENFYLTKLTHVRNKVHKDDYVRKPCSLSISEDLLSRSNVFRGRHIPLSTVLVDLMGLISLRVCARDCCFLLWDFKGSTGFSKDIKHLPVFGAFLGKPVFMKLLLNFGFLSSLKEESPLLVKETNTNVVNFIWTATHGSFETCSIAKTSIQLIKNAFGRFQNRETYKRIFFATVALNAITLNLRKKHSEAEEHVSCLKMYFTAAPDPFLSIFEMRIVLYACFSTARKLDLFDDYCQEINKLLPWCPVNLEPRKLIDFARIQVRQCLSQCNLPLPVKVEKLFVPHTLKCFLIGDEFDISGNTENVPTQEPITKSQLAELHFERPILSMMS